MTTMSGHIQQSVLLALLDLGVAGVGGLATHADMSTASIFTAINRLLEEGLIATAPEDVQDDSSRKGARQFGLTPFGIDVALNLEIVV
jgi:predicted transcriptional regulator